MSTPDEPQNPYGGEQPQDPAQPGYGAPQPPAAPQYGAPQAPQYGAPQAPQYGVPQAPQYGAPDYPGAYVSPTAKNSLGVWALVLGILSVVLCGVFTGVAAIIVGNNGKKAAARGEATNRGLASAGVVLGWIGVALTVVGVVYRVTRS